MTRLKQPAPFFLLEVVVNKAPPIRVFEAHTTPTGFRIGDSTDVVSAPCVVQRLRDVCLTYTDSTGKEIVGVLDLHDNLPTRFPQALQGNPRWSFHIAGRPRNLSLIRSANPNTLVTLLVLERAMTAFLGNTPQIHDFSPSINSLAHVVC